MNTKEIKEELQLLLKGKTLDALIPPFVYVVANGFFDLKIAAALAIGSALALMIIRWKSKKTLKYAFFGLLGVLIAAAFAILSDNAVNYFLPNLLTNLGLVVITTFSLVIRKPLAAWVSHISRGWELAWFWRPDIRPAYTEVTIFWLSFFCIRAVLQFLVLIEANIALLFLVNTLLGFPVTGVVVLISYVYGVWRLKKLGGPGIDEYRQNVPKPWKGQTRGF
ncbi:DUF3159 domain-containing protein [Alkalibacter rhizosphaerae]|uniref:DUF3159 domain-containing protein n=1 Tax=Alkalibacter rhizosphaerae TaxID=2815577 RepID=A0A975AJC4_9FIRM|nr:DUF3159 domain-containing protein [Alkalibacter rhizosphaerae]QSX09460.1 DUF3159 domain-containing protein [Alkalibacter rhizosphaerae]